MKRKLSFENTRRLIEQNAKINDIIRESVRREMYETERRAIRDVNKAVYEQAEKSGMSIWDICFHFIPEFDYSDFKIDNSDPRIVRYISKGNVRLIPVEFELSKGPDYWEEKYRQLKSRMRELLDKDKEEE